MGLDDRVLQMASDKIKENPEKKPEEAVKETASALADEARSMAKPAESPKAAEVLKPAVNAGGTPKLELTVSPELLKNAAMRAELKSQNLATAPATKFDWSVVDTVTSVLKKSAEVFASGSNVVLSYLANPVVAGIGAGVSLGGQLVKVAEGMYQSADKKLTVGKVRGEDATSMKDGWDKMFNSDASSVKQSPVTPSLEINDPSKAPLEGASRVSSVVADKNAMNKDMLRWLGFNENEKAQGVEVSDNLFGYTDEQKKTTEISALPGHVHVEKRDANGNVETIVDKTTNQTMVLHKGEKVTIDEKGKQVIQGDGYKVTWDEQGKRHVFQNDGREVIRDGNSVKLLLPGASPIEVKPGELTVGGKVSMLDSADALAAKTEEIRKTLKPEETYVMTIRNVGIRTIFGTGATFDVQEDRARLETPDHKVFQFKIENDKLLIKNQDGNFVPLDNEQSQIKAVDGKFKIGDLLIDPRELRIRTEGPGGCHKQAEDKQPNPGTPAGTDPGVCSPGGDLFNWNFRTHHLDSVRDGKPFSVEIKPGGGFVVKDGTATYEQNPDDSKVKITTVPPATDATNPAEPVKPVVTTVDLKTTTVETDKVIDDPSKTFIKDTHTVIDKDRNVQFEDGPLVKPDGSVKVDKNTFVDKDLHVSSIGWESSAAQSNNKAPINESNAQSVAISLASKANSMFHMAKAGVVRWTEVASLNSALGDVLSLMSNVPVGSPAHSMLMRSYFMLVQAIIEATPKAQATERADNKESKNNKK